MLFINKNTGEKFTLIELKEAWNFYKEEMEFRTFIEFMDDFEKVDD